MLGATLAPVRVIARLDVKGPNVVKGVQFEGLRIVGTPEDLSRRYYRDGVDEIVFIDIVASLYQRNNLLAVVENTARDVFIPITVGGGIRTPEDIAAALRMGADKVAINTAAVARPRFIAEAAEIFGSQCIVLSIEAKRRSDGTWEAYTDNGRERSHRDAFDWAAEAESLGAGEVLATSIDQDGTRKGFDIELFKCLRARIRIPLVAAGGAGKADDVAEVVSRADVDGVCCGSLFHFGECSVPELKRSLGRAGVNVRQ